ncbi:Phage-related protein [Faunimonas pinastri]|uniref:Phage-related protein n=1 Tax=Faunimonas pinastri TaxID=1855383 RepID=A0A1H9MPV9_9HYPH|nr:phage tail protein [Faunimonas pinastri]SER25740.1 Phage-related protein [Faunimonas pinastri]
MALRVFYPPIPPSPGTSDKPKLTLLKAEFGDGYTQTTRAGLNHIRRVLSLNWDRLLPDQAAFIVNFLEAHGGDTSFYYTPSDELRAVKWTCEEWESKKNGNDGCSVSATFEQSFSLET